MNIFHQRFSTGQVVEAADISNAALQSWIKRDLIVGHKTKAPIEGGGSPGLHRGYSFFNTMEIAVAKALADIGLDVPNAFKAAMSFAHSGREARLPSLPFDDRGNPCITVMCARDDHSAILPYHPAGQDFYATARHQLGGVRGMIVLEIDPIFLRVTTALGHDPRDVMNIAYPRTAGAE